MTGKRQRSTSRHRPRHRLEMPKRSRSRNRSRSRSAPRPAEKASERSASRKRTSSSAARRENTPLSRVLNGSEDATPCRLCAPFLLSSTQIQHLRNYRSVSEDWSILSNYVLCHFWNSLVQLFPRFLAPNLITLMGFVIGMSGPLSVLYFTLVGEACPAWVWLLSTFSVFWYQTCDAVDGKQARRIKASSPLGEFLDHGLDACITQFIIFTMCMAIGSPPWATCLMMLESALSLFFCIWDQFTTGTFVLSYISGPTEGIIITCTQYFLTYCYTPVFWDRTPFGTFRIPVCPCLVSALTRAFRAVSLSEGGSDDADSRDDVIVIGSLRSFVIIGITVSWFATVASNIQHVMQYAKDKKSALFIFVSVFPATVLHLWLYAMYPEVHDSYFPWFEIGFGMIAAISATKMCICRLTRSAFNPFGPYYYVFALVHLVLLGMPLATPHRKSLAESYVGPCMIVLTAAGFLVYGGLMVSVIVQVKNFLGIRVFSVGR